MGSGSLFFFYKAIGMRAHVDFMRAWPDTRSGERKQPLCSTISRHLALVWRLQKKAFGILTNNSQQSNTESLFPFNFLWLKQFSNKKEPVDPKSSAFKKKLLLIIVKNYVCTFFPPSHFLRHPLRCSRVSLLFNSFFTLFSFPIIVNVISSLFFSQF